MFVAPCVNSTTVPQPFHDQTTAARGDAPDGTKGDGRPGRRRQHRRVVAPRASNPVEQDADQGEDTNGRVSKLPTGHPGGRQRGRSHGEQGPIHRVGQRRDRVLRVATDLDRFDPDAVRVGLDVETDAPLGDLDFRIGAQALDLGEGRDVGPLQFTPWASQGGGWTGLVSDSDGFDPDAFRLTVETRTWPSDRVLRDARLGLQMFDNAGQVSGNVIVYTPWASQGGGWTEYAVDEDGFDPDGLKLKLESRFA